MKIIVFDDDRMLYLEGEILEIKQNGMGMNQECTINASAAINEHIKLDPTTMIRILKYNKEKEIQSLDEMIEKKQNKIIELDDILNEKGKRAELVKNYISKIYEIDIENHDDYDDYDE